MTALTLAVLAVASGVLSLAHKGSRGHGWFFYTAIGGVFSGIATAMLIVEALP